MLIRRIARPMLASVFVVSGIDAIRTPAPKAQMASGFIDKSVATLPDSVTDNVPTEAETLVRINGAVQVGAGILLATNKYPRVAALALAGSTVPTTVAGHPFWQETDPAARKQQRTQFLKNVGLLGGLLLAAVDTEGKPSLAWRGRRAAAATGAAIADALPSAETSETAWDTIRDRTQEGAHVLSAQSAEVADAIRTRAPEVADSIRHRAPEVADTIRHRTDTFRHRAPEVADRIRTKAPEVAESIRAKAPEVAENIRAKAPEVAENIRTKAPELVDSVRDQVTPLAEEGRRRWRKARR